MKWILLLLIFTFSVACSSIQSGSTPNSSQKGNAVVENSSTSAQVPRPTESDVERLDRRLPKRSRDLLEFANQLEVFEVEPCVATHTLKPIERGRFLGCKVTRRAIVTDPREKEQFLKVLFQAVTSEGSGMACFTPRHGVRALNKAERIEMLICFECENFRGVSTFESFGGALSTAPEKLFEDILSK